MLRSSLVFCVLLMLAVSPVCGQGLLIVPDAEIVVPLPRPIPQPSPPPVSYRIKELAVQARIKDQVAQVQVTQSFVNTGSTVMEVQFCFPLPYDGAIDRLTLMVDGKEYPARLLSAEEARRNYEEIVRKNRDPALLEWVGTGMFRTSVFPVPPGAERKVTLAYTQLLRQDRNLTDFLFPLSTAKYTSQPLEKLEIQATIKTSADLKSVYSPSHDVQIERPDGRHAVVKLTATQAIPSEDFRLFFDVAEGTVGASVLTFRPDAADEGFFLLLASPDADVTAEQVASKSVVIVLDRSGSMEGQKIEQARNAALFVLNHLREGDHFNIVVYDDTVESFRPALQPFTEEHRTAAAGFVNGVYAGGGTNIADALQAGLAQFAGTERPGYLLFLTDGLPTAGETNEAKIVAVSKEQNASRVRVVNFGVGYDVNSRLLDRLSREHSGQSVYVRPDEDIEAHVSRLYQKINAPVMTGVNVDFQFDEAPVVESGPAVSRLYPSQMPDIFQGEQLAVVGRYRATGRAKIVLTGTIGDQPQRFEFPADFAASSGDSSFAFVEKLWAMRRVGEIIDEIDLKGKNDELVKELVALSTKHGILTPYTSFLADETSGQLALSERLRETGEATERLYSVDGRGGFRQREFKNDLQAAARPAAAGAFFADAPYARQLGISPEVRDLDSDAPVVTTGLKMVGQTPLYRRGELWVTPQTEGIDLVKDQDRIQKVARFSDVYFDLTRDNSAEENQLLSSQQAGEQLLVELRGQVYHIE